MSSRECTHLDWFCVCVLVESEGCDWPEAEASNIQKT